MANADMNRLMDNVRIRTPGALDATIKFELFSVLNEFFQDSNIWYEDLTFAVTPSTLTYLQDPTVFTFTLVPTMGTPNRLMFVMNSDGLQQAAYMPVPGDVILRELPSSADTYTARLGLTVTDPVTREGYPEFPAWILNKYGNDILDGVLSRMMAQVAKPYSNPTMAQYHARKFKGAVSQAKVEAQHQNVYRGQSWRFPQTFARRRYMKF